MGRILFFLLIGLLVWWLVKGLSKPKVRDATEQPDKVEDMVACARCGVNTPRSETREEGGKFYCANNPSCRP